METDSDKFITITKGVLDVLKSIVPSDNMTDKQVILGALKANVRNMNRKWTEVDNRIIVIMEVGEVEYIFDDCENLIMMSEKKPGEA